ncbi:hypothetical protein [Salinibacter sp.]|uniref:hypothetical protein n=1 Tax=Salinibacter sp. TaxID=2065818 RepID=UPI0021E7732C|nr:hypothetical protein [Salinibacter sp.]
MGQQQLLLLVLATVIVGLATVAGIQAFDENRTQAAADALQQKATTVSSDIKGLDAKPQQMGGLPKDFTQSSKSEIEDRLGFENLDGSGTMGVVVTAAGQNSSSTPSEANCQVNNVESGQISIVCNGKGDYSDLQFYGIYDQDGDPQVRVQSSSP